MITAIDRAKKLGNLIYGFSTCPVCQDVRKGRRLKCRACGFKVELRDEDLLRVQREVKLVMWYEVTYESRVRYPKSVLDAQAYGIILWSEVLAKMKELGWTDHALDLRLEFDEIRKRSRLGAFEKRIEREVESA